MRRAQNIRLGITLQARFITAAARSPCRPNSSYVDLVPLGELLAGHRHSAGPRFGLRSRWRGEMVVLLAVVVAWCGWYGVVAAACGRTGHARTVRGRVSLTVRSAESGFFPR